MKTLLLKQIIILIGILVTGLFSLLGVPDTPSPSIEIGQWKIFPSLYSISITHNQSPEDFYKISPYDDVIFYEDGSWDKVIHGNEQILNDSLIKPSFWSSFASPLVTLRRIFDKKIVWPLRTLFKKPQVTFTAAVKGISYQAYRDQDKLVIKKRLINLPEKAIGFGNAFVFSKDDEIFDSEGRQYLLLELKEDRTEISGISSLIFRNPKSTGQTILPVEQNQKVILDKIYRLVEVKTKFPEMVQKIKVEQEILFESFLKRTDTL